MTVQATAMPAMMPLLRVGLELLEVGKGSPVKLVV